jgi:hypothetical protein
MVRSLYFVAMLSSVLVADAALGVGWRKCHRPTTCRGCPPTVYCCPLPCKTYSTNYCLQRIYLDYPGPFDLYECLTHPDGCDPSSSYEELYYGPINAPLVQTCGSAARPCEQESTCGLRPGGCGVPGHRKTLRTRAEARQMLASGNAAASPARFYKIPMNVTQPIDYAYVAIVRIPPSGSIVTERFIGVEMEPHGESLSTATFGTPIPRNGAQFEIDYVVSNGDSRKAYIWRKDDIVP